MKSFKPVVKKVTQTRNVVISNYNIVTISGDAFHARYHHGVLDVCARSTRIIIFRKRDADAVREKRSILSIEELKDQTKGIFNWGKAEYIDESDKTHYFFHGSLGHRNKFGKWYVSKGAYYEIFWYGKVLDTGDIEPRRGRSETANELFLREFSETTFLRWKSEVEKLSGKSWDDVKVADEGI